MIEAKWFVPLPGEDVSQEGLSPEQIEALAIVYHRSKFSYLYLPDRYPDQCCLLDNLIIVAAIAPPGGELSLEVSTVNDFLLAHQNDPTEQDFLLAQEHIATEQRIAKRIDLLEATLKQMAVD